MDKGVISLQLLQSLMFPLLGSRTISLCPHSSSTFSLSIILLKTSVKCVINSLLLYFSSTGNIPSGSQAWLLFILFREAFTSSSVILPVLMEIFVGSAFCSVSGLVGKGWLNASWKFSLHR